MQGLAHSNHFRYKKKFNFATHQFYLNCSITQNSPCEAQVYGIKEKDSDQIKIKKILSSHNHPKLTKSEFLSNIGIEDIPKKILEFGYNSFLNGEEPHEILQDLRKEFKE